MGHQVYNRAALPSGASRPHGAPGKAGQASAILAASQSQFASHAHPRTLAAAVTELGSAPRRWRTTRPETPEEAEADRSSFVIGLIENRANEVGVAAFDLRSASLHLSQYIETSCSYHNTKTLLHFYDPMVIIVPPNKTAADGMVGVSELVHKHYPVNKKMVLSCIIFVLWLLLQRLSAIESEKGLFITNHSLSSVVIPSGIPSQFCHWQQIVTFNGSFDHMNIDSTSVQTLEIIDPHHTELWGTSNKKKSLFQMLKTTKTTGGSGKTQFASLRVVDRIFTRIGNGDNVEINSSTFMTEMKETAFIMQNVSSKYFYHTDRIRLFVPLTWHHHHIDQFCLKDGVRWVPHYGLLLARVAGLPASLVDTVAGITERITEQETTRMNANCEEFRSLEMAYQVAQRLFCLKYSNQGEDYIREVLHNLKDNYTADRLT
ncbi:hypothetical protein ACP70R_023001 [Stipagrostis hirtigluma subsp. patula]